VDRQVATLLIPHPDAGQQLRREVANGIFAKHS
jgi:hypothetical protein